MTLAGIRAIGSIPTGDLLGEGVLWDDRSSCFLWTDIAGRRFHRLAWPSRTLSTIALPYRLGSFALTDDPETIVAAFEQGFARFDLANSAIDWIARPSLPSGVRFNDGRVDPGGRFVAGTMVEQAARPEDLRAGALFRLEPGGALTMLRDGIGISNSLCWSPDGRTMYHADTAAGTLRACSYPDLSDDRPLVTFSGGGAPDGATTDASGRLWVACWGGARIAVMDGRGQPIGDLPLPVSQPTCLAFGGEGLNIVAVTTAAIGLLPEERALQPEAGNLLLFETDGIGLPERRCLTDKSTIA